MDAETFNALALRVIARQAGDDDRRALEAELASAPARRDEFEEMRITHDILRVTAPVTCAVDATTPELPAHRVGELRTAVRQQFGPEAAREKAETGSPTFRFLLRWIFGGTGIAALGFALVVACFANKQIEIGVYGSDTVRDGPSDSINAADVPTARIVAFARDEPFDQWQHDPLKWNEHAKIWVDNEHDLIHVVRRVSLGHVVMETMPLPMTDDAQRDEIRRLVRDLGK